MLELSINDNLINILKFLCHSEQEKDNYKIFLLTIFHSRLPPLLHNKIVNENITWRIQPILTLVRAIKHHLNPFRITQWSQVKIFPIIIQKSPTLSEISKIVLHFPA